MTRADEFDFERAVQETLERIDIGPHCSCADITMEMLRVHLPLEWDGSRYAAAAFGGGVGGSGGPCGALCAGLIALSLLVGETKPAGCATELVEDKARIFYDTWMAERGSPLCSDLTGFPALRDEESFNRFAETGGLDKCMQNQIRYAVESILKLAGS
jgi:C_GCAxxG_C_C family probable redox protein